MYFVLDMPWGFRHPEVKYWSNKKIHVYQGKTLPAELKPFASKPFSIQRWEEDELNAHVLPARKPQQVFTPREHQKEAAQRIFQAYQCGQAGFLESDKTGLGKTLSTLSGVTAIAKSEGFGANKKAKLLIVCPVGVAPTWRQTLEAYPVSTLLMRPLIISYQSLSRLMKPTQGNTKMAKSRKKKIQQLSHTGQSAIDWDYVIFDESHYLKNFPDSTMSRFAEKIAKLDAPYVKGRSPFTVFSTATPGNTPLNMAIMARILAPLISANRGRSVSPKTWGKFLMDEGFAVTKSKKGVYSWASLPWWDSNSDDPKKRAQYEYKVRESKSKQRQDVLRLRDALLSENAPYIRRGPEQIAGWPEQQLIPLALDLNTKQRSLYEEAWGTFKKFLNLKGPAKDPKGALVASLRYRQKSSLIKVEDMAPIIKDLVDAGNQVYVSCEFMDTVEAYQDRLAKLGVSSVELTGRLTGEEKITNRLMFQKGQASVVLCTLVAGISLHAEEELPDGTTATKSPRVTIIHDIRQNALDTVQSLGRAHRDGQNSLSYFPFFIETVDEKVTSNFVQRNGNMEGMLGEDLAKIESMERVFELAAAGAI